jgi:predicted dehydrogenase
MSETKLSVLVIGAGMYVGGRGAGTDGTVLPALMQAQHQGLIGEIHVAATRASSINELNVKMGELNGRLGTQVEFHGYPATGEDTAAYRQALEQIPRPACAIVVVPDHLHHAITTDVIRAGVHPLVVKPLTPTVSEAQDLIELASEHELYGAVEFHKRFDETNLLLRQAISDDRLGKICYATVEYSQRRMMRGVFDSWVDSTNIFQYLGVHYVDLVHFLTGAMPLRALATGQQGTEPGWDAIQALIEWEEPQTERKFVSTIVSNWIDPDNTSAMSDQKITVVGTKGRYQIDQKQRGAQLVTQAGGIEEVNPYFSQIYLGADGSLGIHGYGPRCILQFLSDVGDLIDGTTQLEDLMGSRPSFQDCLPSTAVIEAVNQSLLEDGNWVAINKTDLSPRQARGSSK